MSEENDIKMEELNKVLKEGFKITKKKGKYVTPCKSCQEDNAFSRPNEDFLCRYCGTKNAGISGLAQQGTIIILVGIFAFVVIMLGSGAWHL